MNGVFQHPLRVTGRLFWLGGELLLAALNYAIHCACCPYDSLPSARAGWLQSSSRRVLRVFRVEAKTTGNIPASGLLVCNHLSYLDILVLAALAPCIFVAKHEVKHWPVFGWFAKLAGTVFVHREQRAQTGSTVRRIDAALRTGALLVLFPEGTSSGGQTVLPFKSSLLEPATRQPHSLTAGFLRYELGRRRCERRSLLLEGHDARAASHQSVQQARRSSVGAFQSIARRQRRSQATRSTVARGGSADETRRCHLKSMKVIVTCGPSYEPIDQVRRLTNFSTGELGVHLSNQLVRAGFEVFCLKGSGATHPGPGEQCQVRPGIALSSLSTMIANTGLEVRN